MLSCQGGQFRRPTKCSTYVLMLVSRHVHPIATTAYQYTKIRLFAFYSTCYRMRKVWVVYRTIAKRAKVFYFNSFTFQKFCNLFFVLKTGMVSADGYF